MSFFIEELSFGTDLDLFQDLRITPDELKLSIPKPTAGPTGLLILPDEILLHILSFLPSGKSTEFSVVNRTGRRLRQVSTAILYERVRIDELNAGLLMTTLSSNPALTSLIKKIEFSWSGASTSDDLYEKLLVQDVRANLFRRCLAVEEFTITGEVSPLLIEKNIFAPLGHMRSLRRLRCPAQTVLQAALPRLHQIQSLTIDETNGQELKRSEKVKTFAWNFPSVTKLLLTGYPRSSHLLWQHVLLNLPPGLIILKVDGASSSALGYLLKACKRYCSSQIARLEFEVNATHFVNLTLEFCLTFTDTKVPDILVKVLPPVYDSKETDRTKTFKNCVAACVLCQRPIEILEGEGVSLQFNCHINLSSQDTQTIPKICPYFTKRILDGARERIDEVLGEVEREHRGGGESFVQALATPCEVLATIRYSEVETVKVWAT